GFLTPFIPFNIKENGGTNLYWTSDSNNCITLKNKEKNDPNQLWKLIGTNTSSAYLIAKYIPGPNGTEMCVTWIQSQNSFQIKPQNSDDTKQYFRFEQVLGGNITAICSADDSSVYAMHSNNLVGSGTTDTKWYFTTIRSTVKFKSYPFGINENMKTPQLTIKSIRKLHYYEHEMNDYEANSPYEVEVEEDIEYENNENVVSNLIWFFANADYDDIKSAVYNLEAPIYEYFSKNIGKKVVVPLLNKCMINGHIIYSIRGTEDVLQAIQQ
ncbi:1834_t:CDS:1, partial [Acaulospora morrowiae]